MYDIHSGKGDILKVAYARVSTVDRNLERQIDSLRKFGAEKIFVEKKSGATI